MWGSALVRLVLWFAGAAALLSNSSWTCLRQTSPEARLQYPVDAFEHFKDIHRRLARDVAPLHMKIPGTENVWIHEGLRRLGWGRAWGRLSGPTLHNDWFVRMSRGRASSAQLKEVFGPFVPLLVTWTNLLVLKDAFHYPNGFVGVLEAVLRQDVPYVTVSQNDEGISGECELLMADLPNILVFSSGGYGHLPVPLYHRAEQPRGPHTPFAERKFLVNFVGYPRGPRNLRQRMSAAVQAQAQAQGFVAFTGHDNANWRHVMLDSVATLVPRGFGRSAFKLVETIQHGLIAIYVYSDVPWLPYERVFLRYGYVTNLTFLGSVLEELQRAVVHNHWSVLQRRKALAQAHADSHFRPQAIPDQIFAFLQGHASDLLCQPLPPTPNDEGCCRGEALRAGAQPAVPKCLNRTS